MKTTTSHAWLIFALFCFMAADKLAIWRLEKKVRAIESTRAALAAITPSK